MTFDIVMAGANDVAVYSTDEILISDARDALDLIANTPAAWIVLRTHNFAESCFDLSTRKLGDVLQKFTNYRVRLAITGDFDQYPSGPLKALIRESNGHGECLFVSSFDEAIALWGR